VEERSRSLLRIPRITTNNQITGLQINGAPLLSEAKYFPFGEVKSWTWGTAGGGTSYQRVYDTDGRIASVTLGGTTRGYGFDEASRITSLTDKQGTTPTASTTVGYDELDRLTSATQTGTTSYSQTFTYDLIGNRKTQTEGGVSSTLVYDTASNRLASQTGTQPITYGYDAVGNITSDASFTYTYSGRNRLTEVKSGATVTASYRHNAFGERVSKTQGGALRLFVYDEDGHLLGEYDSQGNLIQETVWLEDTPVATLMPTSPGQPIGAGNPLKVYRIWADHLDTPRAITTHDSGNSLVWSWNSDPFGTTLPQSAGGFEYNLRFPGQYYDSETGFHYNYFRDYNPKTGRYVQSDPIGLDAGVNTYSYVRANPLSEVDDEGLCNRRLKALGLCGKPKPQQKPNGKNPPAGGGVYIIRDCHKTIVYIGKTGSFSNRTSSHRNSPGGMLRAFSTPCCPASIEYVSVPNAQKRGALERVLIGKHRPPGNVQLNDRPMPYDPCCLNKGPGV
jgi:RHS repeat-associated protein